MQPSFGTPQDKDWLDDAACAPFNIADFFVEAGHVIDDKILRTCRGCPVRPDCVSHAYQRDVTGGYFGGLSPGQRRDMTLAEALEFIKHDVEDPNVEVEAEEPEDDVEDFDYR